MSTASKLFSVEYVYVQQGFSLIELLVTLAIVSVLTAIAVPQFQDYRKQGYDARAQADLRNVAIAQEAYFISSERYLTCANTSCESLPGIAALSKGVTLSITATTTAFVGNASHPNGSGKVFEWDSAQGGLIN